MINAHHTKQKRRRQGVSEKEFRIVRVKMMQNRENKTELQIDRLETRTEKVQEDGATDKQTRDKD